MCAVDSEMEHCRQVEVFRLLLLFLCWLGAGPVLGQIRHPLPVLWMMPVSSGSGRENLTAAVIPAIMLALQDLKKQPPPLGSYEIQLQLLDSQVGVAENVNWSLSLIESLLQLFVSGEILRQSNHYQI